MKHSELMIIFNASETFSNTNYFCKAYEKVNTICWQHDLSGFTILPNVKAVLDYLTDNCLYCTQCGNWIVVAESDPSEFYNLDVRLYPNQSSRSEYTYTFAVSVQKDLDFEDDPQFEEKLIHYLKKNLNLSAEYQSSECCGEGLNIKLFYKNTVISEHNVDLY